MSGGHLVVLDRLGRDVKRYPLPSGLATLGSDPACDIRIMQSSVSDHHATVIVRAHQAMIRNVSDGHTLVNGQAISVTGLQHRDAITVGDRTLRWEYDQPDSVRPGASQTAIYVKKGKAKTTRGRSRASEAALRRMDPTVQLMLEMNHRASMPGKQVAVVQPQRRDHDYVDSTPRLVIKPHRPFPQSSKRQRVSKTESPKPSPPLPDRDAARRKTASPKADLTTTKASLWIESRKSTPRKTAAASPKSPQITSPRRATPQATSRATPRATPRVTPRATPRAMPRASIASSTSKRATPLRTVVLRRTVTPAVKQKTTPARVDKIQGPTELDPTKQAALLLMTGRTPKSKQTTPSATPSPSFLVKRPSPVPKTPKSAKKTPKSAKKSPKSARKSPASARKSTSPPSAGNTPLSARKSPASARKSPASARKTASARISAASSRITPASARKSLRSAKNTPENTQLPPSAKKGTKGGRQSRQSQAVNKDDTPRRLSEYEQGNKSVRSNRSSARKSVTILEISDSDRPRSRRSDSSPNSPISSPIPPSPRKSALKDPSAKNTSRKNESIKFDLSNLENTDHSDVFILSSTTRGKSLIDSDDDLTLHYSDKSSNSPSPNPSPRRSIHSRSSRILEKSLGTPLETKNYTRTLTPESPTPRKSVRGSQMVQKVLETSQSNTRYSTRTTKSLDGNLTRTLSPRSSKSKLERYSVVDLISFDSNDSRSSDYNSARSTRTTFATPDNRRKTRSLIDPKLLSASTPFTNTVNKSRRSKSLSTPNSTKVSVSSKRSSSLSTPENTTLPVSINSTRVSRLSRRTANDSDLLILSPGDEVSPKTSKRMSRSTLKHLDMSIGSKSSPNASRQSSKSANNSKQSAKSLNNSTKSSISLNSTKSPNISRQSPKSANKTRLSTRSNASISSPTSVNASITSPRPANSSRQSPKSPNTSKLSPKSNISGRSGRNVTLTIGPSGDGLHTPENRYSPDEASTPVLSIQSLLDSSHSSLLSQVSKKRGRLSVQPSRQTIGGLRTQPKRGRNSAKSKSFYLGVSRKSLLRRSNDSSEISDKTDEGAPKPSNDDNITPKSTVKLVQEAVKNKHSTEKKPQSKRSIIDNLNESVLVKDLFNSPVKRKLSQSMTEFSRTQLFDDEPVVVKRTRNTTALSGRSPNRSLLDRSENFTPEVFVSPLTTPENSPNVSGVKKLFGKNTPQNDLSNVKGVKRLLRTPRARKSVKNDLTNIAGVKNVFAKSPRNSLTNVSGLKNVFTSSPKNDLRRVTGVKSLFQPQRKGKSPKNDLSDLRGVRKLYQKKTPDNDLRNVSALKKGLTVRSPKNDLTDVRGVKRLFTRDKSRAGLSDVSGVEELFNSSVNSGRNLDASACETLFDQAFGKPKVKATYARSFMAKSGPKQKYRRANKSLDTSFELLTNADSWLEKEARKRNKTPTKAQNKSLNKSKARELQKLITDTVEGTEPLQRSRTRISTLIKSIPDTIDVRKSNSALYEKTLPIKKRSFVEASLEKSASSSKVLPIKKRVLVHSTPVKGKWNLTANVSELGRVSPIAAEKTSTEAETTIRSTAKLLPSPKSKPVSSKATRARQSTIKTETPKPTNQTKSARSTRASRASKAQTPAASPKARRGRKASEKSNIKNATGNLVVTLKSPRLNPAANSPSFAPKSPRATTESPKKVTKSPKVTAKSVQSPKATPKSVKSPKTTKKSPKSAASSPKLPKSAIKSKSPRAVAKKAPKQPKASPRPSKATAKSNKSANSPRLVAKKAPKSPVKSKKSPVKSTKSPAKSTKSPVKTTKSRVKSPKPPMKSPKAVTKSPKTQRSTRAVAKKSPKSPKASAKSPKPAPKPKTAAKTAKQSQKVTPKSPKVARSTRSAPKSPPKTATRKTRNTKEANPKPVTPKASPKKPRATKKIVEEKSATPKTRRGKISKNATLIVAKASPQIKPQNPDTTAKRKATKNAVTFKTPPKRGRNKVESPAKRTHKVESPKPVKRGRKAQEKPKESPVKPTRGKKVEVATSVKEKQTRGRKRKSATSDTEVPAKNPRRGTSTETKATRGRKAAQVASPNKSKNAQNKAQNSKKNASVEKAKEVKPARGRKNQNVAETTVKGRKRKSDEATTSKGSAKKEAVPSKSRKTPAKSASPVKAIRTRRQDNTTQASTSTTTRSRRK